MKPMDNDIKIAEEIQNARTELEASRDVVRTLANDLADVADVIEPVLLEHIKRIRAARMTSVDELRQISSEIAILRDTLAKPETARMLDQAERFLRICRELEEFRAVGFIDAFLQAFNVTVAA
jgi:septal ring factor EnvC (AmiA/AmiB activator)